METLCRLAIGAWTRPPQEAHISEHEGTRRPLPAARQVRGVAPVPRWSWLVLMKWTTADIPDQTGRTFVITGANSGLGLEAAKALVLHGASVIAGCRDLEKGRVCLALPGPGQVDLRRLDLADLASVAEFADSVTADVPALDVLINNAGVMAVPRSETVDGFERQFGTNHLGTSPSPGNCSDRCWRRRRPGW